MQITDPRAVEYHKDGQFWLPAVTVDGRTKYLTMESAFSPEFTLTDNPELGYVYTGPIGAADVAEAYVNRMLAKEARDKETRMDDAMDALAKVLTAPKVSVLDGDEYLSDAYGDRVPMAQVPQDKGHRVSVCFRSILEVTVEFDPLTGEVFSMNPYVDTDNDDFALLTSVNGEDTFDSGWCKSIEGVASDIEMALSDRGIEVSEEDMDSVVKATWEAHGIASDIHDVSKAGWDTN
jgi:hypothetical protein